MAKPIFLVGIPYSAWENQMTEDSNLEKLQEKLHDYHVVYFLNHNEDIFSYQIISENTGISNYNDKPEFVPPSKRVKGNIEALMNAKKAIDAASRDLVSLQEENKSLKILLWRMIQKHGNYFETAKLNDETIDEILESTILIDDDMKIKFLKKI